MSSNYRHIFTSKGQESCSNKRKFELSDGFCKDLIANSHWVKEVVELVKFRIIGLQINGC